MKVRGIEHLARELARQHTGQQHGECATQSVLAVEAVQRGLDHLNKGDLAAALACFTNAGANASKASLAYHRVISPGLPFTDPDVTRSAQ